jgi:hypothetical protein
MHFSSTSTRSCEDHLSCNGSMNVVILIKVRVSWNDATDLKACLDTNNIPVRCYGSWTSSSIQPLWSSSESTESFMFKLLGGRYAHIGKLGIGTWEFLHLLL